MQLTPVRFNITGLKCLLLLSAFTVATEVPLHCAEAEAAKQAAFHPINLSAFVQGWDQFGDGVCWSVVPRGLQQLEGVPFQMDGVLEVMGMGAARDKFGENTADARGQAIIDYPANQVLELAVEVRSPTCAPARFGFTNTEPGNLPARHTVTLEPGTPLGGIVRDTAGQPIARARVSVNTITRDEVGQSVESEVDVATTDSAGHWSTCSVPPDFKSLTFKLTHPQFRPAEYFISDSTSAAPQEGSKADLLACKAVMVMEPGTTLAGIVTSPNGKALPGAKLFLRDSSDPPRDRFTEADGNGHFKFLLMDAGQGILAAAADGFCPQSTNVAFEPGLKPVSFTLQPAGPFKGTVLGPDRKPLAGATVGLASWNELPFPRWQAETDAKGAFSWDSAPADGVVLSVRKDGYTTEQQNVAAGDEEVTLVLNPVPQIVGKVVDAATKEPIQDFQIIIGRVVGGDDVSWERYRPVQGSDGHYSYRPDENFYQPSIRLLVEAKGYLPQASPPFSPSGWQTNDFELKKGHGPKGSIKFPDGRPAAGVRVVLLTGDYIQLKNAEIQSRSGFGSSSPVATTDVEGKFALPAAYATHLVAVSRDGYAEAALDRLDATLALTLQPWGRIEGTLRNGTRPAINEWVMVTGQNGGFTMRLQYDFDTYRVQSDNQGRFVLENVPPGERYLTRLVQMEGRRGWMFSHGETITVKAGEVTRLTFGGKGRPVIGKVVPNETREIPWQSGNHFLNTPFPRPPSDTRTREQIESWNNSPEVKEARARHRTYYVRFSDDGSFRIEDVPPGKYELNLTFSEPGERSATIVASGGRILSSDTFIGSLRQEVEVPESPCPTDTPLDLGRLDLVVQRPR